MVLLVILGVLYIIFAIYIIDSNTGIITDREKWRIRGIKRDCEDFKPCITTRYCKLTRKCKKWEKEIEYIYTLQPHYFNEFTSQKIIDNYEYERLCLGINIGREREIEGVRVLAP